MQIITDLPTFLGDQHHCCAKETVKVIGDPETKVRISESSGRPVSHRLIGVFLGRCHPQFVGQDRCRRSKRQQGAA